MKRGNFILRLALIAVVVLSLFLTWKIWTGNAQYQQATKSTDTEQVDSSTSRTQQELYLPTQILVCDNNGKSWQVYNTHDNLPENLHNCAETWTIGAVHKVDNLSSEAYLSKLNTPNTLTMNYTTTINSSIFARIIPFAKNVKRYFKFNRVQISLNKDNSQINFFNDQNRTMHTAQLQKYHTQPVVMLLKRVDIKLPVVQKCHGSNLWVEYPNPVQLAPYAYLVTQQMQTQYIASLFNSKNPNDVDAHEDDNNTIYSLGANKRLTLSHNNGVLIFNKFNIDEVSGLQALLKRGESSITPIANPLTNLRYFAVNEAHKSVSYRCFVEGFPIFASAHRSLVQVNFANNNEQLIFNNNVLQVPLPTQDKTVNLPTTEQVLAELQQVGINSKQIQNIILGYQWQTASTSNQVVNLQPTYYVQIDDAWQAYQTLLNQQTANKVGY